MGAVSDGFLTAFAAVRDGVAPDQDMWVDEWSEAHMVLPSGKSAAPGPYRTNLTPFAREVMRCLSPADPHRRVVVVGPSQLLKTQVGLNFISSSIHQSPGNILALLPTLNLAKRVSSRISDTIKLVPVLRERVAEPRSRDSRNTMDTKEFDGGTLYITTAGSAANLAEIPARYIYGDEIDRWEGDVGGEGDPVELAETRTSTFEYNAKIYYTSSPTLEGQSRIDALYQASDKRRYWVPCPHCGEHQVLEWEQVRWDQDEQPRRAWYVCPHCGSEIDERQKAVMLPDHAMGGTAEWRAEQAGDGQTAGFWVNAMYAPLGFVSWLSLVRQYLKAKARLEKGDGEPMQVFYNTRLARLWDASVERTKAEDLKARAEDYPLGIVPHGGLVLTASVDTQPSRIEVEIKAFGEGMESWVCGHHVLWGDPSQDEVWSRLDDLLRAPLRHVNGREMRIVACGVDSGGHNTQDVYNYTRNRKHRHILALKGSSRPNRPIMGRPSKVDVNWRGETVPEGALLWFVGTDVAKDWIHSRLKLTSKRGPGVIHFSKHLSDDYFAQITAERKIVRYVKGHARSEWVKKPGERNEALDLFVYNLAVAYYLGLHDHKASDWEALRLRIDPVQRDLLTDIGCLPIGEALEPVGSDQADATQAVTASQPAPLPAVPAGLVRRVSRSAYLA